MAAGRFVYRDFEMGHPNNYTQYVVQDGDTLSSIARTRRELSVQDLVVLNGLSNRHHIEGGQVLRVPTQNYLDNRQENFTKSVNYAAYMARTGNWPNMPYDQIPGVPLDQAVAGLNRSHPESIAARVYADRIAEASTHRSGTIDRVVLGRHAGPDAGYIGEARRNGGIWYETPPGVWEAMTRGLSRSAGNERAWLVNESFLRQQMSRGVSRIDFVGETTSHVLRHHRDTFRAREIRFLDRVGPSYGYTRQGNSWVKTGR
jgi:LysM repeat protein